MATGIDATGTDTYATIIAAPSNTIVGYRYVSATCDTNDAIISIDGGTSDFARIVAGEGAMWFDLEHDRVVAAIQGKNATAGSNYANLVINVW